VNFNKPRLPGPRRREKDFLWQRQGGGGKETTKSDYGDGDDENVLVFDLQRKRTKRKMGKDDLTFQYSPLQSKTPNPPLQSCTVSIVELVQCLQTPVLVLFTFRIVLNVILIDPSTVINQAFEVAARTRLRFVIATKRESAVDTKCPFVFVLFLFILGVVFSFLSTDAYTDAGSLRNLSPELLFPRQKWSVIDWRKKMNDNLTTMKRRGSVDCAEWREGVG
jgi:hypothetical protein